ncbi:MAG: Ig-like domain-containing protein [Pirellulaceae bacterium]
MTDVNDAPTLVQTSVTLNPVPAANEDMTALNAPVFLVSSFRTASDVDIPTNSLGIAVTGLTKRSGGAWEFSVNGGASFSAIPASISESQALLLRPADLLRYLPDQQNGEVATITYLAWDQTSHSAGTQVDLTGASATGGTSAFSDRTGVKQTASLTVSSINDAPVAVDDNGGTDEDTAVTITVLANDVEVDLNQTLDASYIVGFDATSSAGATITRNADGTFRYDPTAAPNLQRLAPSGPLSQTQLLDSFTYTLSDGQSTPVSATVRVLVTGKDDAPLPQNDPGATNQALFRTTQNALLNIPSSALLDNDVDDFGDTLRVVSIAPLAGTLGSVSAVSSGGTVTQVDYNPGTAFRHLPLGVAAMDQFLYTVSDQNGVTRSATVTVTVDGLNDAPEALNDQFSAPANLQLNTQRPGVLGTGASRDNDPDDGETNTLSVIPQDLTSNRGAPVTVRSDGSFTYDPRGVQAFRALRPGQTLQDTFVYRVKDLPLNGANQFLEDTATVTVTVTGVNDAPQAVADTAFGPAHENQLLSIAAPGVLANDSDVDGDAIQARAFTGTSSLGAAVTLTSDGSFQYDPRGVAAFQQMRTGQSLTDFFAYSIEDVPGQLSASQSVATVTIVVNGQNDAPLAVNDSYVNSPIDEDAVLTVPAASGLAVNDSDEEGDAFSVVVVPTQSAAGATITLNADGSFAYDPRSSNTLQRLAAGATATDTFTYLLRDSAGNVSSAGTVSVRVSGTNDAPVPANDDLATSGGTLQTDEDSALVIQESTLVANDTDDFGNTFSLISIDTLNTKGSVTLQLDLAGSRITYFPNSQFDSLKLGEQATDVFTYTIRDQDRLTGTATVTVTITGTNDTPIANPDSYTIDEDSVLNVAGVGVLFNDTDAEGDVITTLAITTSSTLGALVTINADGTFTYDPTAVEAAQALDAGGSLQDTFAYTVTDGATQATGIVMMTITGRNDAPRPGTDTYAVSEEGTLNVSLAEGLLSNDVDPEGHAMQASLESSPLHGSVTVNSDGTLTYSPTKDFFGTDTFRYRVSDASSSSVGTVTIQVTGTNDSPVAAGDSYTVNQDSSLVVSASNGLLVNDSDVDQEPLRARRLSGPSRGTVSVNNDGSFTYTPQPGFFGTDTFQYQAFDSAGAASTATVTINVLNTRPWRNPQNALDVSGDGFVTPQDVLLIVNYLNANGPGPVPTPAPMPPPYRDTNGDNFITPNDALLVINFLNQSVGGGEGESSSADEAAAPLGSSTVLANAASALGQPVAKLATPAIERSAVEFVDEVFGDSEPGAGLASATAGVAGVRSTSDEEDAEDEMSSLIEELAAQSAQDDRDSIFGWLGR